LSENRQGWKFAKPHSTKVERYFAFPSLYASSGQLVLSIAVWRQYPKSALDAMQSFFLARYESQLEVPRLAGGCSLSVGDHPQTGEASLCLPTSQVSHLPF
jgi:hypothetical protein